MSAFPNRPNLVERIAADGPVWFVSDLHLGDGTPSDVFFAKDQHLVALVERIEREGSVLVIVGDAIDFDQAWGFIRVLKAHPEVFGAFSRLGHQGRLYYVIGNHDWDLSLLHGILSFKVCDELEIGKHILVRHGWQYDPWLVKTIGHGHGWSTKAHHFVERYFNTWLRIPLSEFYTLPNRIFFWTVHKVALGVKAWNAVARAAGFGEPGKALLEFGDYWVRGNCGDPMGMFRPAWAEVQEGTWRWVVCGHSHLPGLVRHNDGGYVNTGSWTFGSSQYARWDGQDFVVRDWISGRQYGDELYRGLLDGSVYKLDVEKWWDENYLGFLKFREGEAKRGQIRGWERWLRDEQAVADSGWTEPPAAARTRAEDAARRP